MTFSLASNRIGLAFLEALPRGVVMLVNHAFISKEMFDWHVGAGCLWCGVTFWDPIISSEIFVD